MKRLLSVVLLMLLSACTIGQPAATEPPLPLPTSTPSVDPSPSGSPDPSESPDPDEGSPSPGVSGTESTEPDPSTSPTPGESSSPSTEPTGSAGSFRAAGEILDMGGEVTTTVLDSKRAKVAGHRGSQVLVMGKTCNVAATSGIEMTWETWVLLGPDSEVYPASTTGGSAEPTPVYPNGNGRLDKPGQCAKGWIVFDVPTGTQLSGVRYMNSNGDSAQWRLRANI